MDLVSSASLSPFPSPLIFFPSLASDCFFELASTASEIRELMARERGGGGSGELGDEDDGERGGERSG